MLVATFSVDFILQSLCSLPNFSPQDILLIYCSPADKISHVLDIFSNADARPWKRGQHDSYKYQRDVTYIFQTFSPLDVLVQCDQYQERFWCGMID